MRYLSISGTAGGFFIFSASLMPAQKPDSSMVVVKTSTDTSSSPIKSCTSHDEDSQFWLWRHARVTGGQITLPFKIRKNPDYQTFRLTTDVTLGGYIGYTRQISTKRNFSLTVPLTAGLTFINLNENNTTLTMDAGQDMDVVPGITWSTGLIFQLEQYSIGLMVGKDYASNVGNQWEYHGKMWWSFGIGFVFLQ
ncbi:MAG: hypothetical protein JNJ57_00305 [Saprospiraceae bacterium]|nr:hypothetical protein [Saprospiraceae bacterium]